jgi:hypothetical protein
VPKIFSRAGFYNWYILISLSKSFEFTPLKTRIRVAISFFLLAAWLSASLPWDVFHQAAKVAWFADCEKEEGNGKEKNERQNESEKDDKEIEPYDKDFLHTQQYISSHHDDGIDWNHRRLRSASSYIIEIQVPPPQQV